TSPWVLGVSGLLALTEFFADKIPGVDSGWDFLQTLARIPAGAFLAAAALSPDGELSAGMLATGAGVALGSHALKAGGRVLINASPEPLSNWGASATEDVAAIGLLALVGLAAPVPAQARGRPRLMRARPPDPRPVSCRLVRSGEAPAAPAPAFVPEESPQ